MIFAGKFYIDIIFTSTDYCLCNSWKNEVTLHASKFKVQHDSFSKTEEEHRCRQEHGASTKKMGIQEDLLVCGRLN